jgi:hypothetical protein
VTICCVNCQGAVDSSAVCSACGYVVCEYCNDMFDADSYETHIEMCGSDALFQVEGDADEITDDVTVSSQTDAGMEPPQKRPRSDQQESGSPRVNTHTASQPPLSISSFQRAHQAVKWECSRCTYRNANLALACGMCE